MLAYNFKLTLSQAPLWKASMEISQVVKKSEVLASTLRFYEEKGLITSIGRQGIRRVFSPNVLERLELDGTIKKLEAMRDGLQHTAACTAPSHLECPRVSSINEPCCHRSN